MPIRYMLLFINFYELNIYYYFIESMWYSYEILPIINSMLPRPPIARPVFNKRPSCELDDQMIPAISMELPPTSVSQIESYEYKDNLWNEMDEFESGEGLNELEVEDGFNVKSIRSSQRRENNF